MQRPPLTARGHKVPRPGIRAATFRFGDRLGQRLRLALTRDSNCAFILVRAMRERTANSDACTQNQQGGNIRAGFMPVRRMAEKRPPAQGEMEHVHDIHGGIFADGFYPGRA